MLKSIYSLSEFILSVYIIMYLDLNEIIIIVIMYFYIKKCSTDY